MKRPLDGSAPSRQGSPYETVVDGQTFVVRMRTDEPGTYDFDWVSGPNEGYGLGLKTSDGTERTTAELDHAIREFLLMIDPATGYIESD